MAITARLTPGLDVKAKQKIQTITIHHWASKGAGLCWTHIQKGWSRHGLRRRGTRPWSSSHFIALVYVLITTQVNMLIHTCMYTQHSKLACIFMNTYHYLYIYQKSRCTVPMTYFLTFSLRNTRTHVTSNITFCPTLSFLAAQTCLINFTPRESIEPPVSSGVCVALFYRPEGEKD